MLEAEEEIVSIEAYKNSYVYCDSNWRKVVAYNKAAVEEPTLLNSEKPEEHWLVVLTDVDEAQFMALEDE